jgi:hypothetical protein
MMHAFYGLCAMARLLLALLARVAQPVDRTAPNPIGPAFHRKADGLTDALGLAPGARLQASIDRNGRLVLVPSKYEPQDLFRDRPTVNRVMTLDDMDRAIALAVGGEDA